MVDLSNTTSFAPVSTALADAFLAGINIFNAFVWFTHLHPVESPLKKPFANAMLLVVSKFHSTPFAVSTALAALIFITACSSMSIEYKANSASHDDTRMLIRAIVSAYTFAITSLFVKHSNLTIKLSIDRVLEIEQEAARHDILKFEPPRKCIMEAVVAPMKSFLSVESSGIERIPDGVPHLFVSNHSLYGLEMPLFVNHLYQEKGIFPRGLADHFHFAMPNGPMLRSFGAVDGTKENVDTLMEAAQDVLVYPGGGHEVLKHSSVPRYELMWKQRVGFARCAIKHGYPIIPCACVGTEDMFINTPLNIPTPYKGLVIPISVTTPCRVQKVYIWFGEPISTKQYNGEFTNDGFAREVRDKTKAAIEAGIQELQEKQTADPERYLVDQCTAKIRQYFVCTSPASEDTILSQSSFDEKEGAVATADGGIGGNGAGKLKMK